MMAFKSFLRRIAPLWCVRLYHYGYAVHALWKYDNPSKEMIIIGITGTKGKTSTAIITHTILQACGINCGLLSTAEIRIGSNVQPNTKHMTMPGKGWVQEQLRKMADGGCELAIVETTSEGIHQYRHLGVQYDILIYTNLSPEHLHTHKTFDNYKATKGLLFKKFSSLSVKEVDDKPFKKSAYFNADDEHYEYFYNLTKGDIDRTLFGVGSRAYIKAKEIVTHGDVTTFKVGKETYTIPLVGVFNVKNTIPAILIAMRLKRVKANMINDGLKHLMLPGRMEKIDEGQPFAVYVDYAHEPLSIRNALQTARTKTKQGGRVIAVTGAVGGGRYLHNAHEIGCVTQAFADDIIITDIDPFDDDPKQIALMVVEGVSVITENQTMFVELDRVKAIRMAMRMAKEADCVMVMGKGAEVTMITKDGVQPFDEREVVREAIRFR